MGVVGVVAEVLLMKQEIYPWRCLRRGSCENRVLKMTGCSPTTPCQSQPTNHPMTDTNPRDLIQRMAKELDLYRQIARDNCTSTHPLADQARAYLAQSEPEGPTDEELRRRFLIWWREEASAMRPHPDHDHEEHARRISEIAWANGAYVARWGRSPQ